MIRNYILDRRLTGINDLARRKRQNGAVIAEDQSAVIAFLADARNHGAGVESVGRVETHISEIFLAGETAYKLKRAVKFPYLDFSNSELRRAACEAEVALNRRTAPALYLGTAAVTRGPDGALALDTGNGDGVPVDWLVVMRRFAEDDVFDRMAARGALDTALVERLADTVARFHAGAEPGGEHGGAEGMRAIVAKNAQCLSDAPRGVLDAAGIERLDEAARAALDRAGDLLDARRAEGSVRRCHGDLHLRNIVLVDGAPVLFDCIEFSESLACIDVLYDFAFLLMDLLHRDLRPLANAALNRYLDATGDYAGLAALPLFLSCRAAVRAHVTAAMLADAADATEGAARPDAAAAARAYLDLALDLLPPPPPRLVAVGGLSGTGKSTLARAIAPEIGAAPGAVVLRSDLIRKELMGVGRNEKLPEEGYSDAITQRVYAAIAERAGAALAAGHAVVADAVHARPGERAAIAAAALRHDAAFAGLWLEAPGELLEGRVSGRTGDASDADAAIVRRQLGYELGEIDWARVDASGGAEATLAAASAALETGTDQR